MRDVSTSELYRAPRPTISFELYPPRTPRGEAQVWDTITALSAAHADYFSVTYGASGTTADRSQALVAGILQRTSVPVIAHLTCVGRSRAELREVIGQFLDRGVRDFLALRGDPPTDQAEWQPAPDGVGRASELVELIREVEAERFGVRRTDLWGRLAAHRGGERGVSIAVAAYPGCASEDGAFATRGNDLLALRAKQDAGADFAITQLFFDVAAYRALLADAHAAGVHIPLIPGIMPLTDPVRIRKLCQLNAIPLPLELLERLEAADPEQAERIGLDATAALVNEVLVLGAPGLHLYTFNQHEGVLRLLDEMVASVGA